METIKIPAVTKRTLHDIYDMQKGLLVHYMRIEGLPPYPLDLEKKPSQKLVKEFKERIIGELAEAFEQLMIIWVAISDNEEFDRREALGLFNEELADALHFFIELLLYSGIEASGIDRFFYKESRDPDKVNFYEEDNPWRTLFNFAQVINLQEGNSYSQYPKSQGFMVLKDVEIVNEPQLQGGRFVSSEVIAVHEQFLWEITYMLNKAVNSLKIKDWAQSERQANIVAYHENLMESFLHFIRYLDFMGQNEIGMFNAYYLKNKVLQNRIANGY